jgi:hypothetical protein
LFLVWEGTSDGVSGQQLQARSWDTRVTFRGKYSWNVLILCEGKSFQPGKKYDQKRVLLVIPTSTDHF